jgi:hypothetical protein
MIQEINKQLLIRFQYENIVTRKTEESKQIKDRKEQY